MAKATVFIVLFAVAVAVGVKYGQDNGYVARYVCMSVAKGCCAHARWLLQPGKPGASCAIWDPPHC